MKIKDVKLIHNWLNEHETLCGIVIYAKYPRGFPLNVESVDTTISGSANKVTCKRCKKIMFK